MIQYALKLQCQTHTSRDTIMSKIYVGCGRLKVFGDGL